MPLHPPLPRAALASLAFALVASARVAAADPPPSDLPPITTGPATDADKAPPPPALVPPSTPITPPRLALPRGLVPGYVPYPYRYPYQPIVSEAPKLPVPPPRRYYSEGLLAGGVVAVAVGLTSVFIGSYFVASSAGRIEIYCDMPSFPCAYKTDAQRLTGGAIMMAAGGVVGVAGIPMWFIGSRYVFLKDEKKAALGSDPPVDVRVGAGRANLIVRF